MALDATLGGVSSTSYVTLAEGEAYYADSLYLDRWNALSSKEQALVTSTRVIDSLTMNGAKTDEAQALQLPRTGLTDRNGVAVDSAIIPNEVKQATYDLALYLGENPDSLTASSGITRIKVDVIEIEQNAIELGNVSSLPNSVQRLLEPFLSAGNESNSSESLSGCLELQ